MKSGPGPLRLMAKRAGARAGKAAQEQEDHCLANWGRSPQLPIRQTPSGISEAASVEMGFDDLLAAFPLPWSAYVRLLSVTNERAREFYETEALRGGWSVPTTRPPDQLAVLRAHGPLEEQGRHADSERRTVSG